MASPEAINFATQVRSSLTNLLIWSAVCCIKRGIKVSLAAQFLGCAKEELMLPDTDFVIFCNPPGGYSQGWHRDTRVYGAGGDWSEAAQKERWVSLGRFSAA
jgi:hypothetical protein